MTTLEWGDSFDHYNKAAATTITNSPMGTKWTGTLVADSASAGCAILPDYARPGAKSGHGMLVIGTAGRYPYKTLPGGAQATRCISGWWNPGANNTSTAIPIFAFYDANAEQCSIRLDSSSHIIVSRGATLLATSTNTVSTNTWYHIQFKATIHNTAGNYEVRVNGTSTNWIPAQGGTANTRGTGTNNSATQCVAGGINWQHDDYAVWDDFPGVLSAAYLRPAAPGNYAQWSPNSGNNHGAVADLIPDSDASFVATVTAGHIDTHVLEKLPVSGTPTIAGIQHVIYAKQDAGVQRTVRPKQRASGTDYNGTSVNTTTAYAYITEAKSVDPATSAAYTKTSLEAAEFGFENV